jgi:hypothetical protein
MSAVTVTFFADRAARVSREERLQLSDLAGLIRDMVAVEKERLPWLKMATFGTARSDKGALRHDGNVTSISGIEADYDDGQIGYDKAVEIAEKAGLACIIYTSPSHTPDKPRWRVLCPTSEDLPPADRYRLVARLNGLYGGIFADESFTLSQSYYYGHLASSRDHRVELIEGQAIDELHELDRVAIGRSNGGTTTGTNGSAGPVDVAELEEQIATGEHYHVPCARLAGYWKRLGVPLFDASGQLEKLFDSVFPPDKDARWQARRADVLRIVADIYRKDDAAKAASATADIPGSSGPAWPEPLGAAAYHGLVGEIVRAITPGTEADPAALLVQLLVLAGCHLGPDSFYFVEGTRHAPRLFTVLVGKTSIARKGSAFAQVRRLFDAEWMRGHIAGGLSSGEGLIERVRDRTTREEVNKKTGERSIVEDDPGIDDKRLICVEEEFARVLRVKGRDQNILADILRQAWDGQDLGVMTRKRTLHATAPHIAIIGHITADELNQQMDDLSTANGLGNRFLFCCVQRSKLLPFGGGAEPAVFDDLRRQLAHRLDLAPRGAIGLDDVARVLWARVYPTLAGDGGGLIGALCARAAPLVMRIALVYALLDGREVIGEAHLQAGLEVWRYAEASARYAFRDRTGNPTADRILAGLRDAGASGLAKTQIFELFARHANATGINAALRLLQEAGSAAPLPRPATAGNRVERWAAI